jgi:subtilisin family serine protease
MDEKYLQQEALTDPIFDALTVQLAAEAAADQKAVAERALAAAINEVPGMPFEGWRIKAVHESVPDAFDIFPPPESGITVSQAFDLKYALEKQAGIRHADPMFETTLDNYPESDDAAALEGLGINWFGDLSEPERDPIWSLRLIQVMEIWDKTEGEGVTVGHPDSGYIPHHELDDSRIVHEKEFDFYDGDDNAQNPLDRGGNHGLSTASVILSGKEHLSDDRFVVGVAPKAKIIPMRITKKGPPVFLFRSGPRRVRDAIYHAIDNKCDVISMSLGGVGESSLRRAIQEAVAQNIIVLAAAGNGVPFVVWPARYPETIAVAACDINRGRWNLSSRGSTVDITAPGHNVWRAYFDDEDREAAKPSSGTSYATAVMGGVAALWLAFHGRDNLLQKYADEGVPLNDVFRRLLKDASDPPPLDHNGEFGAGIVNVKKLLEAELPDPATFAAPALESLEPVELQPAEMTVSGAASLLFETVPHDKVEERLAQAAGVPTENLDAALDGYEEELMFHMVTNPELRDTMVYGSPTKGSDDALESAAPATLAAVPGLSDSLRGRLGE